MSSSSLRRFDGSQFVLCSRSLLRRREVTHALSHPSPQRSEPASCRSSSFDLQDGDRTAHGAQDLHRSRPRARALFASMTQGMTAADLRRSPMPVLGEVSGKAVAEKKKLTFGEVMKKSRDRAFRGGIAGFAAGVVQVSIRPTRSERERSSILSFKTCARSFLTTTTTNVTVTTNAKRPAPLSRQTGRLLHVASYHHELPVRQRRHPR